MQAEKQYASKDRVRKSKIHGGKQNRKAQEEEMVR